MTTRPGEPGPAHLPEPVRRYRGTAEHVLDALLETAPEWATRSGDHRFDGRAADLSPAGVAHDGALLRQAASALDDLDDLALDLDDRVDLEILRAAVMRRLWQAEDLTVHTWNPLAHLPRDLPAGPPGDGRPAGLARLAAVPRGLEVAREVLGEMPRLHVEAAVARVGTLRGRLAAVPVGDAAPALRRAVDAADRALAGHLAWLEDRLPGSDRDPRLGPERYAAQLWHALDSETAPDVLLVRAESDLLAVEEQTAEVAARIDGAPPRPGQVREVLDRLGAQVPPAGPPLARCERALDVLAARLRDLDLVTPADRPVPVVLAAPGGPWIRCVSPVGSLDPAGPALPVLAVSPAADPPVDRSGTAAGRTDDLLATLLAREATPGRALQRARAAARPAATRVRQALPSAVLAAGWAGYAQEVAATGAPDAVRLQQLVLRLRATIEAIVDVRVHAHGMTEQEATALIVGRGHRHPADAARTWRRSLLAPGVLPATYEGIREVAAVVRDVHRDRPEASRRQVHDAVLVQGAPPPRHLRSVLLPGGS